MQSDIYGEDSELFTAKMSISIVKITEVFRYIFFIQ